MTFKVERDIYNYACAISENGQWVIHLKEGTEFNENNIDRIVNLLNESGDKS